MTNRGTTGACALPVVLGAGTCLWLALPALRNDRTAVGIAVTVCGALAVVLGLAGLVAQARSRRPRP